RETTDWELDVRTELRQLDRLRPLDIRQEAALQDEYAVRRLREDELPRAPRPVGQLGQRADWLRPVGNDVVGAERILATFFAGYRPGPRPAPARGGGSRDPRPRCRPGPRRHPPQSSKCACA